MGKGHVQLRRHYNKKQHKWTAKGTALSQQMAILNKMNNKSKTKIEIKTANI